MQDAVDLATDFKLEISLSDKSGLTDEAVANRALVVATYLALEAGQEDALAKILDPDILFVEADSLPYGGTKRGIAGTMEGVGEMLAAWRNIHVEITEFLCAGDLVIAYMVFHGISRATGQVYTGPCAEVFRLANGKITEWRPIYWDTKAAAEAAGLSH